MTTPPHTPSRPRRRMVGALTVAAIAGAAMVTATSASAAVPTGTFSVANFSKSATVPVSINASAGGAPISYSIVQTADAAQPAPGAFGAKPANFAVAGGDGGVFLHAFARDDNNPADIAYLGGRSLFLDRVLPTVAAPAVSDVAPSSQWYRRPVRVSWAFADAAPSSLLPPLNQATADRSTLVNVDSATSAGTTVPGERVCDRADNCVTGAPVLIKMDLTAPNVAPGPAGFLAVAGTRELRPTFTWTKAGDALSGIKKYYLYLDNRPEVIVGPSATQTVLVPPANLPTSYQYPTNLEQGRHTFEVVASDLAGNLTSSGKISFVYDPNFVPTQGNPGSGPAIIPGGAGGPGTSVGPGGVVLPKPVVNTSRLLSPKRGVRVGVRPTLKWKATKAATRYRVQIYRLRPNGKTQLRVNTYTTRTSLKVPRKVAAGSRVVWRVWAYKGKTRIGKAPIGVSYFDLLTPAQLRQSRVTAPKAKSTAVGSAAALRWQAKPKSRNYRVVVTLGGAQVYTAVVRGTRQAIPAASLSAAGTYKVKIIAGVGTSKTRFGGTWAETTLSVN